MLIIQILLYLSILTFGVLVISKIIKIATAPVHLRWELYPVPHEPGKAEYGGSKLEEVNWWEKEHKTDYFGELKAMLSEILFLKAVWEHNRILWFGTFAFHWALYLFILNIVLLLITSIFNIPTVTLDNNINVWGIILYIVPLIAGFLGIIGAIRLFFLRVVDTNLKNYSTPSHYFNILLIGAIFLTYFLWVILDSNYVITAKEYYKSLITFSSLANISLHSVAKVNILLTIFFLFYLPFTHMTHFFAKYFTYHKVRWDDQPNFEGGKMAQKISELLNQPVSWSAPHIGADGRKNWIAIVTEIPTNKEKKNA